MSEPKKADIDDSTPSVHLTVGELKALVREEVEKYREHLLSVPEHAAGHAIRHHDARPGTRSPGEFATINIDAV